MLDEHNKKHLGKTSSLPITYIRRETLACAAKPDANKLYKKKLK